MTTYNVYAGQVSNGLNVGQFDRLNVYQGGTAVSATNAGTAYVYAGGVEAGDYNSGGADVVYSGGAIENATVDANGREYLSSGSLDQGGEVLWGDVYAFSAATVQGLTVSTGTGGVGVLAVYAGANLDNVMFAGGEEDLMSGVVASGAALSATGLAYLVLDSGSEAISASVQDGGKVQVFDGALSVSTSVGAGGNLELVGGTESGAQIANGGQETIEETGGSFGSDTISGGGLLMFEGQKFSGASHLAVGAVSANTTAFGDTLQIGAVVSGLGDDFESGASETVSSGYDSYADQILAGGVLTALSGSTVEIDDIETGGSVILYSGASFDNSNAFFGGTEVIVGGYDESDISLQAADIASLVVSSGSLADDVTVSSGGTLTVRNLGAADDVSIASGGLMVLSQGGQDGNVAISTGGSLDVLSGGIDSGTAITGGREVISAGGTASALEFSRGTLVDNGTVVNGAASIRFGGAFSGSGAVVQSGSGALTFAGTANTFTGEVIVSGGAVEFANAHAPGGGVGFEAATGATTLKFAAATTPASRSSLINPLIDFDSATKRIDLLGTAYVAGATAVRSGDTLTLTDGSYILTMTLSGLAATKYVVASDGRQGVLIHAAVGSPVAPLAHAAAAFGADRTPPGALPAHESQAAGVAPLAMHSELGRTFNSL